MIKKQHIFITLGLVLVILFTGCEKEAKNDGRPVVVASFYPVYDLTHEVAEDHINLRSFMPIQADPHLWEPTPRDLQRLQDADLLIVNGANMENWIDSVRQNLPNLEILVLSDFIDLITYKGAAAVGDFQFMAKQKAKFDEVYKFDFGHTHEDIMRVAFIDNTEAKSMKELIEVGKKVMEEKGDLIHQRETINVEEKRVYSLEMGHDSGEIFYTFPKEGDWVVISDRVSENLLPYDFTTLDGEPVEMDILLEGSTSGFDKITYDPHSWLSLNNAKSYINAIYDRLEKMDPDHQRDYYRNKVSAIDRLTRLQVEFKKKFSERQQKSFVVTHYAYQYLAEEMGLVQYPLQGLISTESPSLKTIKKAIEFCEYHKIQTIFYEAFTDNKGADSLAEEINGNTDSLISMEYMPKQQIEEKKGYIEIMRENLEKIDLSLQEKADESN